MSTPDYNVASPQILFCPWAPAMAGYVVQDSASKAAYQRITSTVTETIESFEILQRGVLDPADSLWKMFSVIDIFVEGNEVPQDVKVTQYAVNGTANNTGGVSNASITGAPAPSDVSAYGDNAFWVFKPYERIDVEFASATFGSTRRCMHIQAALSIEGSGVMELSLITTNGGTNQYALQRMSATVTGSGVIQIVDFGECPFVDLATPTTTPTGPLTPTDVQDFDSGTTRLRLQWIADTGKNGRVDFLALNVVNCDENRAARAGTRITTALNNGTYLQSRRLFRPDGTTGWAKTSGTNYTVIMRRPVNPLAYNHLSQDGFLMPCGTGYSYEKTGNQSWADQWTSGLASIDADGGVLELTAQPSWAFYAAPIVTGSHSGGAMSVDALSFLSEDLTGILPLGVDGTKPIPVNTGTGTVTVNVWAKGQDETPGSNHTYHRVMLTARYLGTAPTADLTVDVRDRTAATTLATFNVTQAMIDAGEEVGSNDGLASFRRISVDTAAMGVTGGDRAGLQFTSATSAATSWQVFAMSDWAYVTGGPNPQAAGFGAALIDVPATPVVTGAVATTGAIPDAEQVDHSPCGLYRCDRTTVPIIDVRWQAPSSADLEPGRFARYEVERSDLIDTTYRLVGTLIDEGTALAARGWLDREPRLAEPSFYRVRNVRTDGPYETFSAYSTVVTGTPANVGAELVFTSNYDPTVNVAYIDPTESGTPTRDWTFPEANEWVFQRVFGRDMQVGFHGCDRRGSSFTRRLLIALTPPHGSVNALDAFRDLAWQSLPYVCVRDHEGGRWFAALVVPTGAEQTLRKAHYLDLSVVEVTADPVVVVRATTS